MEGDVSWAPKCSEYVHFRLHMYANSTWLSCTTQNDKPCVDGIHVQFEMNVWGTFGNHGMGVGDTPPYYIILNGSNKLSKSHYSVFTSMRLEHRG